MRALACALAIAAAVPAFADPPGQTVDQKRAAQLFEEGRTLLTAKDFTGACKKFDAAIALDSLAPGTMLNLGLCNEELGKFKTALYWFRKAEQRATEVDPPLPPVENAAKEHTAKLATEVAHVTLAVTGDAPNPVVKIDGEDINRDDFHQVEIDPGHHVLAASAAGMKNIRVEFDVKGGSQMVELPFVPGDNTVIVDRGAMRRRAAIVAGIVGAVVLATGSGVALYEYGQYHNHKDTYEKVGTDGGKTSDLDDANHAAWVARYWGTGLVAGGLVAMGAAAFVYFTAPQAERVDQTVFAPVVAPDHVGFALSGSF
ncbi:MAG TPA: tetratricopeptide repeat protein [Kofleriaceae bacterium]|jgi:tetratricopeptide (TPR) repeat protein